MTAREQNNRPGLNGDLSLFHTGCQCIRSTIHFFVYRVPSTWAPSEREPTLTGPAALTPEAGTGKLGMGKLGGPAFPRGEPWRWD
jgi:hypothetical protein